MSEYAPSTLSCLDSTPDSNTMEAYNAGVLFEPSLKGLTLLLSGSSLGDFEASPRGLPGSKIYVNPYDEDLEKAINNGVVQEELAPLVGFLDYTGVELDTPYARILYLLKAMGYATVLQGCVDKNEGNTERAFVLFRNERKLQIATLPLGKTSTHALNDWDNNYKGYKDKMVERFGFDDEDMQQALNVNSQAFNELPQELVVNRFALGVLGNILLNRGKPAHKINRDHLLLKKPTNDTQQTHAGVEAIADRQKLVDSLINDPGSIHIVSGKFGNRIFGYSKCAGIKVGANLPLWDPDAITTDNSVVLNHETKLAIENEYGKLSKPKPRVYSSNTSSEDFKAIPLKILDKKTGEIVYTIRYLDSKSEDRRPGVYTEYSVILPKGSESISLIDNDPSLLIDMMRTAFPEADRSTEDQPLRLANQPIVDLTKKVASRK